MSLRPTLTSFRVLAYTSENRAEGDASAWEIKLDKTIEIGVGVPTVAGNPIQALVKIQLRASAQNSQNAQATAAFSGEYLGSFNYPASTTEAEVTAMAATDDHQYLLAAQAFPLAMSHFRRELQSTGFDARNLPLGL